MENKIKEFLLRESLLRYTSIDREQRSQSFISPLQRTSDLLWVMNRAKLCPPPPDLETTDPKIGEQRGGGEGPWPCSSCSPVPPWLPGQPLLPRVLPSPSPPARPAPPGAWVL